MLRRSSRLLIQQFKIDKGASSRTLCSMNNNVVHDAKNNKAYVQYDRNNSVLDLFETEVPVAFRGRGIAQILAKAAFDHVVQNNLKMKVTCTYLQSYLSKNPVPAYTSRVVD
ncbi:Protein NATD1 [Blattella germanica]|nr:Protein NATD1 [Blattella germanica]